MTLPTNDTKITNVLLSAALYYASHGWLVIPLHTIEKGICTCSNGPACDKSPGKHPRTKHGYKDGSSDPVVIRKWWARWPDANIGIVTGPGSRIFVLDVDPKHGGAASLADLELKYGPLPDTFCVRTGGGGWHYYFIWNDDYNIPSVAGDLAPGLDTRGSGGYVVAPLSLHESGNYYEVAENAVAAPVACPKLWLEAFVAERGSRASSDRNTSHADENGVYREGTRRKRLCRFIGAMSRQGMTRDAMIAAAKLEVEKTFDDPASADPVEPIVDDFIRKDRARQAAERNGAAPDAPSTGDAQEPGTPSSPASEAWPELEALGAELPSVPPFDLELLPDVLRPMVEDVADRMQVPIDFPAIVAVATLAGLCNRRAVMQPKERDYSWLVVPNLWGGIVAPPAMMKSPVIACITAPAHLVEAEWRTEYESELSDAKMSKELTELKTQAWKQQYIAATKKKEDQLPIRPDDSIREPRQKRLLTTDATFESLQWMMANNPAGIFVLRDELTGWLAGLERQGREQERAFFLECWNGDTPHTIDRIGRGSIHVDHCCVSLFGGIQPARLRAYLADALRDGPTNDGLIQRFQLLVWPDTKPNWCYRDRLPDATAIRAAKDMYRRIATMDVDNPLKLRFAPDAQALFVEWLTDLETHLRADDVSVFMQAHLGKYRKLMPALALLFSIADGKLESVGLAHEQRAAGWCDYLACHARRVYASRISPERLAAMSLGKKLRKGWKRESGKFSVRDVYQNDWIGLGTPEEVRAAVRVLEEAGWVRPRTTTPETGRPSEVYEINPKIGGVHADH